MTKQDILSQCTVAENTVFLPKVQLERKLYQEVASALEKIGGKWNKKLKGFLFPSDPKMLLDEISNGTERNLKKEFQFFSTPNEIADQLVELADIKKWHIVLEPSAGHGALIEGVLRHCPEVQQIDFCELMPQNLQVLASKAREIPAMNFVGSDFIEVAPNLVERYDVIIANPPFAKNQDILHLKNMYTILKRGGRLVCITSQHWQNCDNTKEKDFRQWLDSVEATVYDLPKGAFKESGTEVGALVVVIDK